VVFAPGDWAWVHYRKERFPNQRKNKLDARGDGPFLVLERINDDAYKIDLPGEYGVPATFNISDLSPFDMDSDLRTNLFEEGGMMRIHYQVHLELKGAQGGAQGARVEIL
jgi:hypothetical protein